ncbi:GMC family oxidoreductase [Streptomyces paludis]|uniref:Choline oxidase n=1 Tax=Streptomyces paludis TaxID=2282738 RepID=A0A345HYN0_9ACTN|nr:GMC oxidoreductase [Streptomyces paludis]AXG81804.1 choline oxidase [Streptomyces paludis]
MTTPSPDPAVREYDYVVVGGGTAGCVLASRLSEDPSVHVALLEWGPSDLHEERARAIRRWAEMVESEYDLDYRSVPQERGNSGIRQTRMRILGGCSTTNTMIAWRPLASDLREWVALGATGWTPESVLPYYDRLLTPICPVAPEDRNPFVADVVAAAAKALGVPLRDEWNDGRLDTDARGAGFFEVGYTPESNLRSSTSIHYLHALAGSRPNLHVLTGARARRVVLEPRTGGTPRATGVELDDGGFFAGRRETIISAGAIDTVKLLQLSGIGPSDVLDAAGVEVLVDAPGVGENLQDHAEGLVVWESTGPPPATSASGWDAGAMFSLTGRTDAPDVLMHFPVEPVVDHPLAQGFTFPENIVAIAPNVAKPASRGRVWIETADIEQPPKIDYRYFTDPAGHDEKVLLAGVRAARRIAEEEPMRSWLVREVFPGPDVRSDEELSRIARATHQTVYHVSGTCRMGSDDDPLAVLDPELRVRGVEGLRVADASAFPALTATNPVVTVMVLAERAADLILSRER